MQVSRKGYSPYKTVPPNNGLTLRFVVVLFATVQLESSNPVCTSGRLSLNFHPVNFGTDTLFVTAPGVSCPVRVPCPWLLSATDAPLNVTLFTAEGAMIVSGTDWLRSPRSARVSPEIVALRTRFGPPTRTVVFVPNCQNVSNPRTVFAVAALTAGAQNVAAVTGSAKSTSCVVESQSVTSPVDPGLTPTVVMPPPTLDELNLTREDVVRVPVPVSVSASSCDWSASPKTKRTSRAPMVPAKKTEAVVKRTELLEPKGKSVMMSLLWRPWSAMLLVVCGRVSVPFEVGTCRVNDMVALWSRSEASGSSTATAVLTSM